MTSKFKNPRAKHNFVGRTCSIAGIGSYVPEKVLTNHELEKIVETSDEWITTRTGIKERRIAAKDEFTSDLATKAAQRAMKMAGITADQIDLIIVATITPDMPFPATACIVQHKIGAKRAAAFDLEAACSGFIYALEIGQQFIMSRTYDTVLVIGAEKLSAITDWTDRNTCVLFGDGAGAAILQNRESAHGLLTAVMGADGEKADLLFMPGGGSKCPASRESVDGRLHYLRMEGKETFKNAVQAMQPRGGQLDVRAARDDHGLAIEFRDTGPGVDDALRSRIFEPFFTTKPNGTGLGLAIVRQAVEASGGTVEVDGVAGAGAIFRVRLPAARVES